MRAAALLNGIALLCLTLLAGCSRPAGPLTKEPPPRPPAPVRSSGLQAAFPRAARTPAEEAASRFAVAERSSGRWLDTGARPAGGSATRGEAELAMATGGDGARTAGAGPVAEAPSAPVSTGVPAAGGGPGGATARAPMAHEAVARRPSRVRPAAEWQGGGDGAGRRQPEALQAGEVDDNRLFEKYLQYARKYDAGGGHLRAAEVLHRFEAGERYRVRVVDGDGSGVPDAEIVVEGTNREGPFARLRTASSGEAFFFPAAVDAELPQRLALRVRKSGQDAAAAFERRARGDTWTIRLVGAAPEPGRMTLDLCFLVDTTGSMSEEISRVRDTIHSVSDRIRSLPAQPNLRLGIVLYRDRGDEYVTRRMPFMTDVDQFHTALREVEANGGGDEPEDLNAGLQQAVEAMDWTRESAVRMLFIIADAPPHLDYQDEYDYFLAARRAAEKGIKTIGVSTMGTNDVGEFVFRQLALLTGGRFVFVTRGGQAGITPHHVERQDFSVQRLDDLIVRLVSEELAPLGRAAAGR